MSAALLEEDARSRQEALGSDSYIVEAPAGSGKTELLTQRVLKLLAQVERPEEVVALTFTHKAAGEMRARMWGALHRAAAGQCPTQAHHQVTFNLAQAVLKADATHDWGLLQQPSRLQILTLDALNLRLVGHMPLLSRLAGPVGLSPDPAAHYAQAARRTLDVLELGGAWGQTIEEALRAVDHDADRLASLIEQMLARRDQWMPYLGGQQGRAQMVSALDARVSRALKASAQCFDALGQQEMMPFARAAGQRVCADSEIARLADWHQPLVGDRSELGFWQALAQLLLTQTHTRRAVLTAHQGFPAKGNSKDDAQRNAVLSHEKRTLLDRIARLSDQQVDALKCARELPDSSDPTPWQDLEVFTRVLEIACAQLWRVFREASEVDFIELAQRALLALGEEDQVTDLALTMDYRIRHLLVDEFQDTSPLQVALLARLTAGWTPGDGRTLFLVGDPMQSIYRFRKADVGLFLTARERGIGSVALQSLVLRRNHRACPELTTWINQAFARIFPAQDDSTEGRIRYRDFVSTQPSASRGGVWVHPVVLPRNTPEEDRDWAQANTLVRVLKTCLDGSQARDGSPSIALLVRARAHLATALVLIRQACPALRIQAVEWEGVSENQAVQDILSLVYALDHRADRLHWLALLRAPWCGLMLDDLHLLVADAPQDSVWSLMMQPERVLRLSACGQKRLNHLLNILVPALAHQGFLRPRAWIEGIWTSLGGRSCVGDDPQTACAVETLFDLIDTLDGLGRFSPKALECALQAASSQNEASESAPQEGSPSPIVQVMTIHKAKGLEFDTVIVCGLGQGVSADPQPLVRWEEFTQEGDDLASSGAFSQQTHLLAAALPRRHQDSDDEGIAPNRLYDYLGRMERQRNQFERARLLYVAATRARIALHWVGALQERADGSRCPVSGSLLELLWPAVAADFQAAPCASGLARHQTDEPRAWPRLRLAHPAPPPFLRQVLAANLGEEPPFKLDPDAREGQLARNWARHDSLAERADQRLARACGILVHAVLERIARDGLDRWPVERVHHMGGAFSAYLVGQGLSGQAARQGAARAAAMIARTLGSVEGQWVLGAHPCAQNEEAWGTPEGGRRVDRSFVSAGVRWIIDYKTESWEAFPWDEGCTVESGALQIFLTQAAQAWRARLQNYALLFAQEALPQRLAVFFVCYGCLIELKNDPNSGIT
jgi:ATP-dependent helicase/nuclease subunit A